ncbi:RNA demethylase ALKBH10B [Impatiens glandulifera]|uniref:RNA demethylase ALKBH10B n=1 Tax=Impatiens glandulifera TaxID=253017 RepID=UPI001FB142B9|nr:RNA demethylase ALKBH10B [Impatiens glandulifera]
MPPAAGPAMPCDRLTAGPIVVPATVQPPSAVVTTESYAKDAIIAWFRGEFAAANAIIDALCSHIAQYGGAESGSEYEPVFSAIHRRRLNWIPILQMQKYYSIADVTLQLRRVAEMAAKNGDGIADLKICQQEVKVFTDDNTEKIREISEGETIESFENGCDVVVVDEEDSVPEVQITDSGSQEIQPTDGSIINVCFNHEECEERRSNIKLTKGFIAKEPVKGRTVNIVRGLKLYDDIFNEKELSKINEFVEDLVIAGRNGELPGETYVLYNQQTKGKKRELIQFGPPIFGHIKGGDVAEKDETSHIEPIPVLLQSVIDHLAQWHLISENRKPDSCIINYFDEGEFSPPFLKPPHLEQPISILNLSVSTMAFGRTLVSDNDGNYKGPLMLPLKEGSLLVMRGNSSEVARHVMCPSPDKRVTLTFFRVRPDSSQNNLVCSPQTMTSSVWPSPGYGVPNGYEETDMIPKWGVLRAPVVMLAPVGPMVINPKKMLPRGGTGVFLPWSMRPRKPAKHLPPRAQKNRLLSLPPTPPPPPAAAAAAASVAVAEDEKMSSGIEEEGVSVSY